MDEVSVVALIRSGNADAFTDVVRHYQAPIIRYLYRLTGDFETAKDLAQDTFVQAYKGILRTDSDLRLKAWLYRIATNNGLQHHRRRRILSFIPFNDTRGRGIGSVRAESSALDEKIALQEALKAVPPAQRACLVLHYVEGQKYREIAETLGLTEDAVRMRVARGKQILRREYIGGGQR